MSKRNCTHSMGLARAAVVLAMCASFACTAAADTVVDVPDPIVAAAIREQLGLGPDAPLTDRDVASLTGLSLLVPWSAMPPTVDLTGLEYATGLTSFEADYVNLPDLSIIGELGTLEVLNITGSHQTDVSTISQMNQLESLSLDDSPIDTLDWIADVPQLRCLRISRCGAVDVHPLGQLTDLQSLIICHSDVTSEMLSWILNMEELEFLDLSWNSIDDISFLENLGPMTHVALDRNNISDISPLADIVLEDVMYLWDNQLNAEAYRTYLPLMKENNPGAWIFHDPIPEPSVALLAICGVAGMWVRKRGIRASHSFGCLIACGGVCFSIGLPALATNDCSWDGGAGTDSWTDAYNWNLNYIPTRVDNVTIAGTSTNWASVDYMPMGTRIEGANICFISDYSKVTHGTQTLNFSNLYVSGVLNSGITAVYEITNLVTAQSLLEVDNIIRVGSVDYGYFSHRNGKVTADQIWLGASNGYGEYLLEEGTIQCLNVLVGSTGAGVFQQIGGTVGLIGGNYGAYPNVYVGKNADSQGEYLLSGGNLHARDVIVGHPLDGGISRYDSTFTFRGGGLYPESVVVNETGQLFIEKGWSSEWPITLDGGVMELSDMNNCYYVFVMDGAADAQLLLQKDAVFESYVLVVGDLQCGSVVHGGSATVDVCQLILGNQAGSEGEYTLNSPGGLLKASTWSDTLLGYVFVGNEGDGRFYHVDGTMEAEAATVIGHISGSTGVYVLNGGTLKAPEVYVGYLGEGVLEWNNAAAAIDVAGSMTIGAAGVLSIGFDCSLEDMLLGNLFENGLLCWSAGATLECVNNATLHMPAPLAWTDRALCTNNGSLRFVDNLTAPTTYYPLTLDSSGICEFGLGTVECESVIAGDVGAGTIDITDAAAQVVVHKGVEFGALGSLAAVSGAEINIRLAGGEANGKFSVLSTDATAMAGLAELHLRCDYPDTEMPGATVNTVEIEAMTDKTCLSNGSVPIVSDFTSANFAIDTITLGRNLDDQGQTIGASVGNIQLKLRDNAVNQGAGTADEVLLVKNLELLPGASFDGELAVNGESSYQRYELWYIKTETVGQAQVETVQRLYPGDADLDGDVDLDDFVIHKTNFGLTEGGDWFVGDFDGDRDTDLEDFVIFKTNFGQTTPVPPAAPAGMSAATMSAPQSAPAIPAISDLDGDGQIDWDDFCILLEQVQNAA